MRCAGILALIGCSLFPGLGEAGVYYSGEVQAELPVQWRGFLLDHRALRLIAVPANEKTPTGPLREQYLEAVSHLEKQAKTRSLKPEEVADLGALHVRLGQPGKAVEILRKAQREYPNDFRIHANLGTAWQIQGDLKEAASALQDSVRLAPESFRRRESFHLRLVKERIKQGKKPDLLDDLFDIPFLNEESKISPGKIAAHERKKLPSDDLAILQQLALWLPADGKLLWQLGELANAHGDVRTAASLLDGAVGEFGLSFPEIRKRRQLYREAADEIAKLPDAEHEKFRGDLTFKSSRVFIRKLDASLFPAIRADKMNPLPWLVVGETTLGKKFQAQFHPYLNDLDGKSISITGFMQPLGEDSELNQFMLLEFPVGCWFCETPETTGIIRVQLPEGKAISLKRTIVKIEGTLRLNRKDPEDFLYSILNARVSDPD